MSGALREAVYAAVQLRGLLWLLIFLPLIVYGLLRLATAMIGRMAPENPWAGRLAFWTAATPGLVILASAALTLKTKCDGMMAFHSWSCFLHCYGFACVFLLLPPRAWIRLSGRHARISRLFASTEELSPRLAALQTALDIPIRQLPTDDLVCAMAGVFRPAIFVSRGAVLRLSEEELKAALLHERAHWRRHETLRTCIAMFLAECTILPMRDAVDQYRRCAEFAADHEAAKDSTPIALASTLLTFARFRMNTLPIVNLAGSNVTDRVSLLLGEKQSRRDGLWAKVGVAAVLTIATGLVFSPRWIEELGYMLCRMSG